MFLYTQTKLFIHNKKNQNNPFLKDENINIEENLALDDVSSSCLICHK